MAAWITQSSKQCSEKAFARVLKRLAEFIDASYVYGLVADVGNVFPSRRQLSIQANRYYY